MISSMHINMLTTVFGSQARFVLLSVQHRSQCSIVVAGSVQTMLGKISFRRSLYMFMYLCICIYGKTLLAVKLLKVSKIN